MLISWHCCVVQELSISRARLALFAELPAHLDHDDDDDDAFRSRLYLVHTLGAARLDGQSVHCQSGKTYNRMHSTRSDMRNPYEYVVATAIEPTLLLSFRFSWFFRLSLSLSLSPPVGLLFFHRASRKGTSESGGWARRRRIGGHGRADGRWGNRGLAIICRFFSVLLNHVVLLSVFWPVEDAGLRMRGWNWWRCEETVYSGTLTVASHV